MGGHYTVYHIPLPKKKKKKGKQENPQRLEKNDVIFKPLLSLQESKGSPKGELEVGRGLLLVMVKNSKLKLEQ